MASFDLVSVGLTILDILGRPVAALPEPGAVELIQEIRMTPAGTAAAPAVIAAKLGLRSRLVGAIADDGMGRFLRDALEADGVDTGALQVVAGSRTSATLLPISPEGDRPALHAPGASLALALEPPFEEVLDTRFLHLGGVGAMPHVDGEVARLLLTAARERGVRVTCDLIAPGAGTMAALDPILPLLDFFMPTVDEAIALSGTSDAAEAAAFFRGRGVGTCIFKDGARGSVLFSSAGEQRIPAYEVDAVDTTGCGDSFCGGFVAALAEGYELEESCRFASATAALVASGLGSDAGVQSFEATRDAQKSLKLRGAEA